jgi:hypothetical protein
MSEISNFKVFVICKIMWHDVVVIWQLVDDVDTMHIKRITLNDL